MCTMCTMQCRPAPHNLYFCPACLAGGHWSNSSQKQPRPLRLPAVREGERVREEVIKKNGVVENKDIALLRQNLFKYKLDIKKNS